MSNSLGVVQTAIDSICARKAALIFGSRGDPPFEFIRDASSSCFFKKAWSPPARWSCATYASTRRLFSCAFASSRLTNAARSAGKVLRMAINGAPFCPGTWNCAVTCGFKGAGSFPRETDFWISCPRRAAGARSTSTSNARNMSLLFMGGNHFLSNRNLLFDFETGSIVLPLRPPATLLEREFQPGPPQRSTIRTIMAEIPQIPVHFRNTSPPQPW